MRMRFSEVSMFPWCDIVASFTSPVHVGSGPGSLFWIIPLIFSFSVVYKVTKLKDVSFKSLSKEVLLLFGSIIGFVILAAVGLYVLQWILV